MLTDILIASTDDAPQILSTTPGSWPRLQFNSLDNVALAGLWAALGATAEAVDFEGEKHLLAHTPEQWVFEFPQDFVRRLCALQPAGIKDVAAAWATHDEIARMGASGPAIEPVVEAVRGFARQATGENKSLLLFMSL
ncbi:hypothetical protein SAMN05518854_105455 [Variovorax sp. YR266]|uniref:hypothetical protein n=1 Tax=Variovorax sp. YR266 TaxID=1884386 RepID=UPI000898FF65|nr:hypothetical protein [Variovorax sp. YR266]SDZ39296.1 hypothetical protein SAMN05518854_105455 [Variovorax sp. YR266]